MAFNIVSTHNKERIQFYFSKTSSNISVCEKQHSFNHFGKILLQTLLREKKPHLFEFIKCFISRNH